MLSSSLLLKSKPQKSSFHLQGKTLIICPCQILNKGLKIDLYNKLRGNKKTYKNSNFYGWKEKNISSWFFTL